MTSPPADNAPKPRPGFLRLAALITLLAVANYMCEAFGLYHLSLVTGWVAVLVLALALAYFLLLLVFALSTNVDPLEFLLHVLLSGTFTIFACAYMFTQTGMMFGGAPAADPWTSLYFSIVAFSTLGFGDVTPQLATRFPAAVEAIAGNLHLALVAASVFFLLSKRSETSILDAVVRFRQEIADLTNEKAKLEQFITELNESKKQLEAEPTAPAKNNGSAE